MLGFAGLIVFSMTVRALFLYTKGKKHYRSLRGGAVPLAALGLYAFVTGIYGQIAWPLPGSYNILFYDIYVLVGLLFISLAWTLRSDIDTQHVGMFGFLIGLAALYYGFEGYVIGLTQSPILLLGLYTLFGLTGILSYPMSVMLDKSDEGEKLKWKGWKVIGSFFLLFLFLGSILALFIAMEAIPVHLLTPP